MELIEPLLKKWRLWMPVVGTILAAAFAAGGIQALNGQKAEAAIVKAEAVEQTVQQRMDKVDRQLESITDRVDDVYGLLIDDKPRLRK